MARLGDVIEQIRGVSYKPSDLKDTLNDNSVILLRANNIQDGKIVLDDVLYVSKSKVNESQYLRRGDILVCTSSGSKELVGKAAFVDENLPAVFGAFCKVVRPKIECCKYVGHFFQSPYYRNYISAASAGANINNLRNEHIADLHIPLPPLEEQRKIAAVLDKVSGLIAKRRQQLDKLDELVKSRFIEMFGEIGTDRLGWGLRLLGTCCEINPKKGQDGRLTPNLEVSFIPMSAVSEHGSIELSETRKYNDVKSGFTYFSENDVLFAKITPCMENGKGAVAKGLKNGIGFGSTEFHVLRPLSGISNPFWIYTVTIFKQFRLDAEANMTGSAGQRRVPASFLENFKITLPPIELQNQFAAFVKQTDKSKLAIQKNLEKLEILKKSLMQKYFD